MEKIINQIWVGPYEMPDREKFFVKQVKEKNPDFTHILWTNENLPELPSIIEKKCEYFSGQENYALVADVLRIFLIREYGGIYMDVDWNCHKGFNDLNLENYNGFIVYHNECTTGNEIFGSKSKTGFIEFMYQKLLLSNISDSHMPYWFNDEIRKYYNIPNTWNRENFTPEEFEKLNQKWLEAMKNDNVLALRKWGEFENKYLTHFFLYSWEPKHKQYFKEGNVNYQDNLYGVKIKGYNLSEVINSEPILIGKIKLLKAIYGSNDGSIDVKNIIAEKYIKNDTIQFPVNNNIFSDPSPGIVKNLKFEFEYDGELIENVIGENQYFSYPKIN